MPRMRRNLLIYTILIAIIFSGMCFEGLKTDSFSLYTEKSNSTSSYQLADQNIQVQDECAVEQLGASTLRGAVELVNRNLFDQKAKTKSNNGVGFLLSGMLSQKILSHYLKETLHSSTYIVRSENIIITYIHQKDGSKG